jgi:hypothetical protein
MRLSPTALFTLALVLPPASVAPQNAGDMDASTLRLRIETVSRRQQEARDLPVMEAGLNVPSPSGVQAQRARYFNTRRLRRLAEELIEGAPAVDKAIHTESYGPPAPALPFDQSDAVVRGTITDARALLSEDQTNIFSEFQVQIDEVFKQPAQGGIQPGTAITAIRHGGALRVPTALIRVRNAEETLPMRGGNYVLFLRRFSQSDRAFLIVTGYGFAAGTVTALDTRGGSLRWEGANSIELMTALAGRQP